MDLNFNPQMKLPTYVNTRQELKNIISEREKMEAELKEVEADLFNFEDSSLRRGGPYFGRIARGERAERIIEDIKSNKTETDSNDNHGSESETPGAESSRKVRESERLFSNSSVTSQVHAKKKKGLSDVKPVSLNSASKRP
ncbi:unnamed protein product [Allacma fusca]|uniref:Chromatin modification-related protein MEAF6 n=1 Tax=Allacma fusca TaxID=39272 RepID=A0A8J2K3J3_9HEXA|nr:unnamed protein product [Allacma fusca]